MSFFRASPLVILLAACPGKDEDSDTGFGEADADTDTDTDTDTFSWSSSSGGSLVDSVDGDDGDPKDGSCSSCEAMWASSALTFDFDEKKLGGLPTHAGLVLTDTHTKNLTVSLSATSTCAGLGKLKKAVKFGDGGVGGATAEDRFVGFVSPAGITSITVDVGGPLEVDHLQWDW